MSSTAEKLPLELVEDKLSPPLKWAGGKRWLVPTLRKIYGPYRSRRLVEPFMGGAAMALGLQPKQALLNDLNPHVINFFTWLQRGLVIDFKMEHAASAYYTARERFNSLIKEGIVDTAESAGLFYYLNRTCFNGLCRFNSNGFFNVPFGKYTRINYTSDFRQFSEPLKNWKFKCSDFEKLKVKETDFIYADPPYDVEFTKYSKEDFTWGDQVRLAERLSQHPGPVVASNQSTNRIVKLYRSMGFRIFRISGPRMISCTGDRSRVDEVLAVKNVSIAADLDLVLEDHA